MRNLTFLPFLIIFSKLKTRTEWKKSLRSFYSTSREPQDYSWLHHKLIQILGAHIKKKQLQFQKYYISVYVFFCVGKAQDVINFIESFHMKSISGPRKFRPKDPQVPSISFCLPYNLININL